MKAITYTQYGSPDVLQVTERGKPEPKDNDILIKVRAVEATKGDCELRSFHFAVKWFWLPLRLTIGLTKPKRQVLGGYLAGEVEAIGRNVIKFQPGDQVMGSTRLEFGAYGEYVCVPDTYTLVSKPNNLNFVEAAAVPLGGLNALHFMNKANITPGESVLINGAGGSIGTFAVQIAKSMGAMVTAVDRTEKMAMLLTIGADHVIDYTEEDFTENGLRYDVVFNMVAQSDYAKCVRSLKPKGRYLMGNPRLSDMVRATLTTLLTDKTASFAFAGETEEQLLDLKSMIEAGKIRPVIDRVYPMDRAADAHRRVETEQRLGIVVIQIN